MKKMLSPKARHNLGQIIPFGVIWLLSGWFVLINELLATGNEHIDQETAIKLSPSIFAFASLTVTILGLIIGTIETLWLKYLFQDRSFTVKLLYKLLFYLLVILGVVSIAYPIAASLEAGVSILDRSIWQKFIAYLGSMTFGSNLLSMGVSLFLCFFYAGISENLGHGVLINFFTGKYHKPQEEERIFMFLDMKSSTAVAEKLGSQQYFGLLKAYYDNLSEAIIKHSGEVYQYIGDEIIITWKKESGIEENRCIRCFLAMKEDLHKNRFFYESAFGVIPSFKAGIHVGTCTTGEIGALKKEIFFLGDLLNTAARIQSLCNHYQEDLLISAELSDLLQPTDRFRLKPLGEVQLKGRLEPMSICALE